MSSSSSSSSSIEATTNVYDVDVSQNEEYTLSTDNEEYTLSTDGSPNTVSTSQLLLLVKSIPTARRMEYIERVMRFTESENAKNRQSQAVEYAPIYDAMTVYKLKERLNERKELSKKRLSMSSEELEKSEMEEMVSLEIDIKIGKSMYVPEENVYNAVRFNELKMKFKLIENKKQELIDRLKNHQDKHTLTVSSSCIKTNISTEISVSTLQLRKRHHSFRSLDTGYIPFKNYHIIQGNCSVLEFFVSSDKFKSKPCQWSDISLSEGEFRNIILYIKELFNYISAKTGDKVRKENNMYIPDQIYTFEKKLKNGDDEDAVAGYAERITSQGEEFNQATILAELFNENANVAFSSCKIGPRGSVFIRTLTLGKYMTLCSVYTGGLFDYDVVAATPVSDPDNPINPLNIFSLHRSLGYARAAGARDEFCTELNYYNPTCNIDEQTGYVCVYSFPNNDSVWRMKPYSHIDNNVHEYWPCVGTSDSVNNIQEEEENDDDELTINEKEEMDELEFETMLQYKMLCKSPSEYYNKVRRYTELKKKYKSLKIKKQRTQ